MHSSLSENAAGRLMPAEVEHRLRANLRKLRFGQPQEYAQMEHAEVRKFLSSKSVHSWLSEWDLMSRTIGGGTLELTMHRSQQKQTADFCVQCDAFDIDAEMTAGQSAPTAFPFPPPASLLADGQSSSHNHYNAFRRWPNEHNRFVFPSASAMDASTNTQTTETTGTEGTMGVYRRASLLEEYACERVRQLEQEEEEKRRQLQDGQRKRRKGWWGCCCGLRRRGEGESEERMGGEDVGSSISTGNKSSSCSASTNKPSISGEIKVANGQMKSNNSTIVRRFTLSRSGGAAEWRQLIAGGGEYCPFAAGCNTYRSQQQNYANANAAGNYDNVRDEWRENKSMGQEELNPRNRSS